MATVVPSSLPSPSPPPTTTTETWHHVLHLLQQRNARETAPFEGVMHASNDQHIHCNRYQTNYSPCTPSSDGALHARVRALEADKADLERQVIILKHESATNAAAAATAGGGATPTGGRRDSTKYNRCRTSRCCCCTS